MSVLAHLTPVGLTQKFWLAGTVPPNNIGDNGDVALIDAPTAVKTAMYFKIGGQWQSLEESTPGVVTLSGSAPPAPGTGAHGDWAHVTGGTTFGDTFYVNILGVWISLTEYIINFTATTVIAAAPAPGTGDAGDWAHVTTGTTFGDSFYINIAGTWVSMTEYVNVASQTVMRLPINPAGAAQTLNIGGATGYGLFILTTDQACVLTFTVDASWGTDSCGFMVIVTNGGAHAITWPGTVIWPSGVAPVLLDYTLITFVWDGTNWLGQMIGSAYA